MKRNTLGLCERLKSEKSIDSLFDKGSSLFSNPIRLIYQLQPPSESPSIKSGFTVSKKNFKRATDRNLLKRRMREAYRLNKFLFFEDNTKIETGVEIMFVYQGRDIENYQIIHDCINELLIKLIKRTKG